MVAIPTGIISAGFVEEYIRIKKRDKVGYKENMHFIRVPVVANDPWVGKRVADLDMPVGVVITIIKRKEEVLIPRGDIILREGDSVLLGAEPYEEYESIRLTELVLRGENPWIGMHIHDLDIS